MTQHKLLRAKTCAQHFRLSTLIKSFYSIWCSRTVLLSSASFISVITTPRGCKSINYSAMLCQVPHTTDLPDTSNTSAGLNHVIDTFMPSCLQNPLTNHPTPTTLPYPRDNKVVGKNIINGHRILQSGLASCYSAFTS